MELKRNNILNNGVASLLQKVVRALEQLLLVPFFISSWGAAYYGEWLTLTIIPSVLAFSDMGFGWAAGNSFVLKYTAGDRQGAANVSRTGFTIISFAIMFGMVLSIVIMLLGIHFGWFAKSLISADDAIKALSFMMAAKLMTFYTQLFDAHYRAARKAALSMYMSVVFAAGNILAGFLVLILGYGIVAFAFWQFIVAVIYTLILGRLGISVLKLSSEARGHFDKIDAKQMIVKGLGYMMFPGWQIIFFQGTTFIVRLALGPVAVVVFNTIRTLTRSVQQIFQLINSSFFPELQYELGSGNITKAQRLFLNAIRMSAIIAFFGIVFLAVFGLPIYKWWTQKVLEPPYLMWYLFLVGLFFNAIWFTTEMVYRAMNKPYQLGIPALIVALLSVICSYFCCRLWGLTGAAVGNLMFVLLMFLLILPTSCKLMEVKIRSIFDIKHI
jgi:O-antigen/teichoic acid export membrane protein